MCAESGVVHAACWAPWWACRLGFAGRVGEPQKEFKQGRDMMKCGFTG